MWTALWIVMCAWLIACLYLPLWLLILVYLKLILDKVLMWLFGSKYKANYDTFHAAFISFFATSGLLWFIFFFNPIVDKLFSNFGSFMFSNIYHYSPAVYGLASILEVFTPKEVYENKFLNYFLKTCVFITIVLIWKLTYERQ